MPGSMRSESQDWLPGSSMLIFHNKLLTDGVSFTNISSLYGFLFTSYLVLLTECHLWWSCSLKSLQGLHFSWLCWVRIPANNLGIQITNNLLQEFETMQLFSFSIIIYLSWAQFYSCSKSLIWLTHCLCITLWNFITAISQLVQQKINTSYTDILLIAYHALGSPPTALLDMNSSERFHISCAFQHDPPSKQQQFSLAELPRIAKVSFHDRE